MLYTLPICQELEQGARTPLHLEMCLLRELAHATESLCVRYESLLTLQSLCGVPGGILGPVTFEIQPFKKNLGGGR